MMNKEEAFDKIVSLFDDEYFNAVDLVSDIEDIIEEVTNEN